MVISMENRRKTSYTWNIPTSIQPVQNSSQMLIYYYFVAENNYYFPPAVSNIFYLPGS